MGRGPKPAKSNEAKPPVSRKSPKNEGARVRDLEKRLEEALQREAEALRQLQTSHRERAEAQEQQTATSEILRVLSESHGPVEPVFESIVRSAAQLCAAAIATITLLDGDTLRQGALTIATDEWASFKQLFPRPIAGAGVQELVVRERISINIADLETDRRVADYSRPFYRQFRLRSGLWVPMLRATEVVGIVIVWHTEPGAFSARHVELLKTFADQAVIAIENVRLFNETKEALDRQTATAEILRVISSSPTDLQPVFDTIVRNAVSLCGAAFGGLHQIKEERITLDAQWGMAADDVVMLQRHVFPLPLSRGAVTGRAILDRAVIHVPDIREDPAYRTPLMRTMQGYRTVLGVPMIREGIPIGALALWRSEVRPFSETEIGLVRSFADQAVIAIENVRLFTELQEKNKALTEAHAQVTEALDQQTATSDILRVISSSPTNVQPVFEAVLASGVRLCGAQFGGVFRFDGELIHLVTSYEWPQEYLEALRRHFPMAPGDGSLIARAIRDRRVVQTPDYVAEARAGAGTLPLWVSLGETSPRSTIAIPMTREGSPLGGIVLARAEPGLFSDQHVALLQIFADQAVIAIENVRLFTELQEKNQALTAAHAQVSEALEQQTATSEVLRVISSSPTDIQPVLNTVAASSARLCEAQDTHIYLVDGDVLRLVAHHGPLPSGVVGESTLPLIRGTLNGRAVIERRVAQIADLQNEVQEFPEGAATARRYGHRTALIVPLLREGVAIGTISLRRAEKRLFSERQVALLQTFADQAVIAIENVRLFNETKEALDRQTATADVLKIISRSTFDLEPVLNTLIESATRLCGVDAKGFIFRRDGDVYRGVADFGATPEHRDYIHRTPVTVGRGTAVGRAALERRTIHFPDILADPEYEWSEAQRIAGFRAVLAVPMLREGAPIGVFFIWREEVNPFTDAQIQLVTTFADQAVIAIENTRLLGELRDRTGELIRSVQELTALSDVSRALSSTLDLDAVLQTIVSRANQLAGTDACSVFEYDEAAEAFHLRATNNLDEEVVLLARQTPIRKGEGVQGRMAVTHQPVQVPDIANEDAYRGPLRDILLRTGTRAVLAIPMLREHELIGGLTVNKRTPGEFSPAVIELLTTFATQSALAIQNARLFREIEIKSRELAAASQHKSEFLANMSHELRTPLNAIIGFSEVLAEKMFGELNEKQEEYSKDIHASGQHLLSLINDILDLSKIEAGRMELELSDFHLPTALDSALTLVRERAGRRSIALHLSVDERLGPIQADERKVRQVVLNLLSNAIKFTPEGGRIEVRATSQDDFVEVSISDTGVGIAPGDQDAVFEEFRQVGTADKKVEGTGLGLTLCRKFVELHGGRIWVKSQVGVGSTFTFTIPDASRRIIRSLADDPAG